MMGSMALVSGSGFFFWMIAAHLYKDMEVGLATAVVSVITFIMNVSILGLNYSIIRFLPKKKDKNSLLSVCIGTIALASILCSTVFLYFLPSISPKLTFLLNDFTFTLAFIVFCMTVSIDFLTESIFMALRAGKYIFQKNLLVSVNLRAILTRNTPRTLWLSRKGTAFRGHLCARRFLSSPY